MSDVNRTQKKGELHRHAGPLYLKDLNGCNGERKCTFIGTPISFFVTGIPGDEEERAGMALQYPLLSASALELRFLFFYPQNNLYNKHEFHFRFLR